MILPRLYYFTPPEQSDPDWRTTYIRDILQRANTLLVKRNPCEIQYMLNSMHYVLNKGFSALLEETANEKTVNLNPAAIVRTRMAEIDIADQSDLPNASWPEYFAALAVGLCESAFMSELQCLDPEPHVRYVYPPLLRLDGELIGHAAEAVALAEILADGPPGKIDSAKPDKQISLKRQAAAIKRWAESNDIKERFVREFRNGKYGEHSVREAAGRFFDRLSEEGKIKVTGTRSRPAAVRNLAAYYRKCAR